VEVIDGPNQGRSAVTDGNGSYALSDLKSGGFTAGATAQYYHGDSEPVTLTSDGQHRDFRLAFIPPWHAEGVGDNVFEMPTSVHKVRIRASFTGFCC
jgi:hypothetical protein